MAEEKVSTSFARTHKALQEYDATQAARDAQLNAVTCNEDVHAWQAAEVAAQVKVAEAFWEDTQRFNNRETVLKHVRPGPAVPPPGQELSQLRRAVRDWLRCRYKDCVEQHPVAGEADQVTCPSCRTTLGLPPL